MAFYEPKEHGLPLSGPERGWGLDACENMAQALAVDREGPPFAFARLVRRTEWRGTQRCGYAAKDYR